MATTLIYLTGKAKWYQWDATYSNWSIDLYPDEASLQTYRQSGLQLSQREDEDGIHIKFRRPKHKLIKDRVVEFDAPPVIDEQGEPVDKTLGNGSTVTIKVSVFDTKKGRGHRLEAIQVHELVEYVKPDNGDFPVRNNDVREAPRKDKASPKSEPPFDLPPTEPQGAAKKGKRPF